jgi:hypothetical protein
MHERNSVQTELRPRTVGRKANDIDGLGVTAQCRQEFDRDLGSSRVDTPNLVGWGTEQAIIR